MGDVTQLCLVEYLEFIVCNECGAGSTHWKLYQLHPASSTRNR